MKGGSCLWEKIQFCLTANMLGPTDQQEDSRSMFPMFMGRLWVMMLFTRRRKTGNDANLHTPTSARSRERQKDTLRKIFFVSDPQIGPADLILRIYTT